MINPLTQVVQLLPMINQEGGAMPGKGLTAIETFTYFVAAPIGLFLLIGGLSWIASAPKKTVNGRPAKPVDVISQITD